jgi:hypothetical protein
MKNTILIIGNGFDLQCDLKSSYKDFFEDKKRNNDIYKLYFYSNDNFWTEIIKVPFQQLFSKFSIWDMLFILKSNYYLNKRWCDIEKEILDTFLIGEGNHCFWQNVLLNFDTIKSEHYSIRDEDSMELKLANFLAYSFEYEINDINKLVEILFNHLKKFEESFSQYLQSQLNQNYIDKEVKLFKDLFSLDGDTYRNGFDNRSVISFNYTNHMERLVTNQYCSIFTNVHGNLDSRPVNIIIGIDDYEMQSDQRKYLPEAIIFSKSFRIMTNFPKFNIFGESLLHEAVNNIVFYGHSLNKADYSYFQSIFDHYDLYKSKVVLWFAFTKFDFFNEQDFIDSIRTLITEYGKTLDNKDHGKNLFHKLLLENRIKKIEIQ